MDRGLVWLKDCDGYREPNKCGIAALMVTSPDEPGFVRLAQEVNPRAQVRQLDAGSLAGEFGVDDALLAWEIVIDDDAEPALRSDWADITGKDMWEHDNSRHFYHYERYDA